jgi:hypothetical protein
LVAHSGVEDAIGNLFAATPGIEQSIAHGKIVRNEIKGRPVQY